MRRTEGSYGSLLCELFSPGCLNYSVFPIYIRVHIFKIILLRRILSLKVTDTVWCIGSFYLGSTIFPDFNLESLESQLLLKFGFSYLENIHIAIHIPC